MSKDKFKKTIIKKSSNRNKNTTNKMLYSLFERCLKFPVIGNYLYKIKKVYMLLMPTDEFSICVTAMILALKTVSVSFFIFLICVCSGKMHFYNYIIVVIMLIIVNSEIVNKSFDNAQYKLLLQLENYLGDVRYYFHNNGVLEDAIFESLADAQYEISLHINQMYELLISDENEKTYVYKEIAPNRYFMTLFALCELVMKYGDTVKDNNSIFLDNLNSLRDEIRNELLKINKVRYVFSGLWIICIIPPFTLKLIEVWGESNIENLELYYDGKYGLVSSVGVCILSLISYSVINILRNSYRYKENDNKITEYLLGIKCINNRVLKYMYNRPVITQRISKKLKRAATNTPIKNYILKKWLVGCITFIVYTALYSYYCFLPSVNDYNNHLLLFLCILPVLVIISAKMLDIELSIRIFLLKHAMEDEILAFHSIISMLMYISRMDIQTVLEWMENFAEIFKPSLTHCCNEITYDEEQALIELEKNEPYLPFIRIVENLKSSDRVGIEKAFEEIYTQRKYYIEKRKQDNEINIANKGAVGRIIAFIPMVATIGGYLIVPFVLESLKELSGYVIS